MARPARQPAADRAAHPGGAARAARRGGVVRRAVPGREERPQPRQRAQARQHHPRGVPRHRSGVRRHRERADARLPLAGHGRDGATEARARRPAGAPGLARLARPRVLPPAAVLPRRVPAAGAGDGGDRAVGAAGREGAEPPQLPRRASPRRWARWPRSCATPPASSRCSIPGAGGIAPTPPAPCIRWCCRSAALDFDDHNKVEQAVEMAGCTRQYPDDAALCVAVGSNPWAGGFIYVVGHAPSPPPVAHRTGEHDLTLAQPRCAWTSRCAAAATRWIAPFEPEPADGRQRRARPPDRLRRGRRRHACCRARCATSAAGCGKAAPAWTAARTSPTCARRAFFSVRLPVEVLHEDVVALAAPGLAAGRPGPHRRARAMARARRRRAAVRQRAPGATPPFSLRRPAARCCCPARRCSCASSTASPARRWPRSRARAAPRHASSWMPQAVNDFLGSLMRGLLRRLPVEDEDVPIEATETIRTPPAATSCTAIGDERSANRALARGGHARVVVRRSRCWWRSRWPGARSSGRSSAASPC